MFILSNFSEIHLILLKMIKITKFSFIFMNALKALNYQTFTDFYSHKFLKQKNNLLTFVTLEIQHYRDWLTLPYLNQGIQKGKYHCTVDLLFDWFGICSMYDNRQFFLQNRLIETSQTGGQLYSDTSPFSIPCLNQPNVIKLFCCRNWRQGMRPSPGATLWYAPALSANVRQGCK